MARKAWDLSGSGIFGPGNVGFGQGLRRRLRPGFCVCSSEPRASGSALAPALIY